MQLYCRELRLHAAVTSTQTHSVEHGRQLHCIVYVARCNESLKNLPITSLLESQIGHETMASGAIWGKEEVIKMIEARGEDNIQAQLQDCTRNQRVFEKVAQGLSEAGHSRTYQQCRDKIKKLRAKYKKL